MELEDWVRDLIKNFRAKYESLNEEGKQGISILDDLRAPLQVHIYWIENKINKFGFQVIIFTHWNDLEDSKIMVYGPFESYKLIESIERLLKNKLYDRKLPLTNPELEQLPIYKKYSQNYSKVWRRLISNAFQQFKQKLSNLFFEEEEFSPKISIKSFISKESFYWLCYGRIQELDIEVILDEVITTAKDFAKSKVLEQKLQKHIKKSIELVRGFGTYFYPPIWVGEIPEQTLRDEFFGRSFFTFLKCVIKIVYKGRPLLINNDGFISIVESEKEKALELLNEIMALAFILDLPVYYIRDPDIAELKIDVENLKIVGRHLKREPTIRIKEFDKFGEPFFPSEIRFERKIISEQKLKKIVKNAEELIKDDSIRNYLFYLLESYTHYSNSEYSQSFIMSWIIIEKKLFTLWKDLMINLNISSDRKRKLKNPGSWTTDHVIEALNFAGKITNDEYKFFIKFKRLRNKIAHDGKKCSKENAERCLNFSKDIINEMIKNEN